MDSILDTIKKMLGINDGETAFDTEITNDINTVFLSLNQLGVGPPTPFVITGSTETWAQFVGTATNLEAVKSYIHQKVRLLFDTPSTSYVTDAIKDLIAELEWRLNVEVDTAPLAPEIPPVGDEYG